MRSIRTLTLATLTALSLCAPRRLLKPPPECSRWAIIEPAATVTSARV